MVRFELRTTHKKAILRQFCVTMSDDEADPELLALLRQSLGLGPASSDAPPDTKVLKSAEYIYDNAVDVSISSQHTKAAAETIWKLMQEKNYSTQTWSEHELHPKAKDESTVNFIFTMNLLNFSFWSELSEEERFAVEYKGTKWTGYWSLVAALQRALDEGQSSLCPQCTAHASPLRFVNIFQNHHHYELSKSHR